MSFDAFCLWLLALVFASAFLMKLAEAVQTIARARLLEAEVAERDRRRRYPKMSESAPDLEDPPGARF